MTPKQKAGLSARQAGEHAQMMLAWLDQNGRRLGPAEAGLRQELLRYLGDIDRVQAALDRPAAIGIVSAGGAGLGWLVNSLMTLPEQRGTEQAQGLRAPREASRGFLPEDGQPDACATVRFVAGEATGAPSGFPFAITLLDLADVAAMLVRTYYASSPGAMQRAPSRERIADVYEEVGRNLAASRLPGLGERDVRGLRDQLSALFPEAGALKTLAAAGYWEDLAEVSEHLPAGERLRVLSLLWGEEEELTRLFALLGEALSQIGYASEAFCAREAFLSADPASGWTRRHGRSVLDVQSIAGLGDEADERVRIVGRYGQKATLARSALAALLAEVAVAMPPAVIAGHASAEIMVFPGLHPQSGATLALRPASTVSSQGLRDTVAGSVAHAKARHLFERAQQRHETTALVVVVDPAGWADDSFAAAIGDWIDQTQGATPHARERNRTRLFVVATKADRSQQAFRRSDQLGASRWSERLDAALSDVVGGALDWPGEWVPGRPFSNIFLFRHPMGPGQAGGPPPWAWIRPSAARQAPRCCRRCCDCATGRGTTSARTTAWRGRWPRRMVVPGCSRQPSARFAIRAKSSARCAGSSRSCVAACVRGCAGSAPDRTRPTTPTGARSSPPSLRTAWIASPSAIAWACCCNRSASQDGELRALFWQRRTDGAGDDTGFHGASDGLDGGHGAGTDGALTAQRTRIDPRRAAHLASLAFAHWDASMRRSAGSGRLAREIGLAGPIFGHVVDEISLGARRLRLEQHLAQTLAYLLSRAPAGGEEALFASCAGPIINGFVERLDIAPRAAHRFGLNQRGMATATTAAPPLQVIAEARHGRFAAVWCEALVRLIEGNVAAQRLASGAGMDPDLTRLAASLPPDNEEADL